MPRAALALTLIVAAALIALALAATAPFHSPTLAERTMCPEGTSLRIREYHASWHTPGETGISIACVDSQGAVQPSDESEKRGFLVLLGLYFLPSLVALLTASWLVVRLRRRSTAC